MTANLRHINSIKVIGLLIILFGAAIIVGNSIGMGLMSLFFEKGLDKIFDADIPKDATGAKMFGIFMVLLKNYYIIASISIVFGVAAIVGGINIRKQKLWANRLITILCAVFTIFYLSISFYTISEISAIFHSFQEQFNTPENKGFFPVQISPNIMWLNYIISTVMWIVPPIALIWFLNKSNIIELFE